MKNLKIILFLLIFFFTVSATVFAQEISEEELAQEYGITFPIKELGGCIDIEACTTYCNNSANQQACVDFAVSKGLYEDYGGENLSKEEKDILEDAKKEFECTSLASCRAFCEQPVNHTKCESFARRQGFDTTPETSESEEFDQDFMKAAKRELGCDSEASCQVFCEQEANWDKCSDFAQRHNLGGAGPTNMGEIMTLAKKILGCTGIRSCTAFCENPENQKKCQEFFKAAGFDVGEGSYSTSSEPPEVWCPKAGESSGQICIWDGTQCTCWDPKACEQYEGCKWTGTSCECAVPTQEPPEIWCSKSGESSGLVCSWDGSQCTCWDQKSCTSPCTWTGVKCDCPEASPEESPEVWCPRNPGCNWTGTECLCSGGTDSQTPDYSTPEPPEIWCPRNPDCHWTGSVCECTPVLDTSGQPTAAPSEQVQGIRTGASLLQTIWLYIKQKILRS